MKALRIPSVVSILFLLFLGFFFLAKIILESDLSPTIISRSHPLSFTQKSDGSFLQKGRSISGSFIARYDHLGIVLIPMRPYSFQNTDTLTFRMREKTASSWIYVGDFDVSWINTFTYFPFGFPKIQDSEGKTYYFEIQSHRGTENNSISIQSDQTKLLTKYQFPKSAITQTPYTFIKGKIEGLMEMDYLNVSHVIFSFLPLFLFLLKGQFSYLLKKPIFQSHINLVQFSTVIMTHCLTISIVLWPFLTSQKVFILHQHDFFSNLLPNYIHIGEFARAFVFPVWSFSVGLGSNIFAGSFMRVSVVDPFTWITHLFDAQTLLFAIPSILLIKIVLAGSLFYLYLRLNGISHISSLTFSNAYALSGQMIARAPWYHYATEMVFLPLMLIALDQILHKRRSWPIVCCFLWLGSYHIYHVLLYGVFSVFYLFWKYYLENPSSLKMDKKTFLTISTIYIRLAFHILIGLLLASPILLPMGYNYLQSARSGTLTDDYYAVNTLFVNFKLFMIILIRFLGNGVTGPINDMSAWANSLEDPALYGGILTLLFFIAFPFYHRSRRYFFLFTCMVFFSYLFIPPVRNVWNIFYGNRFKTSTFFLTTSMLLLAAMTFDRFLKSNRHDKTIKIIGLGLIGFLILFTILTKTVYAHLAIHIHYDIAFIFIAAWTTIILSIQSKRENLKESLMIISIASMTCLTSLFMNNGQWIDASYVDTFSQKITQTKELIARIHTLDKGFYRIGKDFSIFDSIGINDSVGVGYKAVSSYQSFQEVSVQKFNTYWDISDTSTLGSRMFLRIPDEKSHIQDMVARKYVLYNAQKTVIDDRFVKMFSLHNTDVYQNTKSIPFGSLYQSIVYDRDFQKFSLKDKVQISRKSLILPDTETLDMQTIPRVRDMTSSSNIQDTNIHLSLRHFDNTDIRGVIGTKHPGIMLFPFSYNKGWNIAIDGRKSVLFEVNGGLTGAYIPSGEHEIHLYYEQPFLKIGMFLSGATLCTLFLLTYRNTIKKRREK